MDKINDEQLKTVIEHRCAKYKSREEDVDYQARRRNAKIDNSKVEIRHKIEQFEEDRAIRRRSSNSKKIDD